MIGDNIQAGDASGPTNHKETRKLNLVMGTPLADPPLQNDHEQPGTPTTVDYMIPRLQKITPQADQPAGRLKYFVQNWRKITSDKTVLEMVEGYQIPLISTPLQWRRRVTKARSAKQMNMISQAILDLTLKGAVKQVVEQDNQFLSTLFLVEQADKVRPILNLKALNQYVHTDKFKLENLDLVKTILRPNDFLMKLDLKDGYFSVPIAANHKKYLRFQFQGITYEYQCLPFDLSSAPRAFTKLLKPVVALLRSSAIQVVIYLDDLLLLHESPAELQNIFQLGTTLLTDLGFCIQKEKCSQSPTQAIVFLGAVINSVNMTLAVPAEKLNLLQQECRVILQRQWCTMLELSALLGRMNQTARIGIWEAPLHYRALQRLYITALHRKGHFTSSSRFQIPLSNQASLELKWWISDNPIQVNKMALTPPPVDMTISTDASKKGWGASCQGQKTGGNGFRGNPRIISTSWN